MAELMKGKVWHERKHLVKYPVFVEVKHDEIRCHVRVRTIDQQCSEYAKVEFISYAGNPLANMERFADQFILLASRSGIYELDCGFEVNGNFKDSSRWIRSTRGVPADLVDSTFKFFLFDLPNDTREFGIRRASIVSLAKAHRLEFVHGEIALNEAEVEGIYNRYREQGFEGAMVKSQDHLYQRGKRIDGWLKMKPENDASAVITAINQARSETGEELGRAGSVTAVLADGSKVSPHGIPHALGKEMWDNPQDFIGETIDFKFMEREVTGGYRHPTFHRIREAV